ncbi:MAG: translation initiation factor IF-2 [Pseudomonadota bacterium]|jgi:translation initiation factor IF-2|nr:translation initiation factor IF-2 [Sphingomonadaceae bacterium]MCH2498502.1 translation initiation factor IF-2 [Erythrobacter sp.]MEC7888566.1 translation initiation factor IF-2 [Pseudomonadota bacterium]MEC7952632.1 translation initiation factor IF-2 [Pseudomonadota bacterium]MEE2793843.1 translation initiation factor IF-2 [Pseudomonadota bacterium]|tara:strand:+ start:1600 stop:4152 length:2553 start_codon:yes stop_codon:yes gene_type:complete
MSDDDKKPARKPLTLKGAQPGEVKQTFSHGRTNKVAVEVKRRRKLVKPGETPPAPPPPPPAPEPAPAPAPTPTAAKPEVKKKPAPSNETPQERVARLQREAEEDRLRQAEEARKREEEQARQAVEDEKKRAEENRKAEEEAAKKAAEEPKKVEQAEKAEKEPEAPAPAAEEAPAEEASSATPAPAPRRFTPVARPEIKKPERKKKEEKPARGAQAETPDKRRSGKLTVKKALNEDEGRRARSLAALKRAREKERRMQGGGSSKPREKQVRDVIVPEAITVGELAKRMGEKGADLVKELFNLDMMVTVNQTIDQDTAELLVEQFGHTIQKVSEADVDIAADEDVDPEETLKARPPVVTIMGHVDHGKTSLLDALRGANVVKGEAGGITQHIGSYQVKTKSGDLVTFLDTPGHAAFTQMRQRGANITDIVVLVVAADDGIMPQTIEAINHTKAAGVPMIVAINKMDKPEANPDNIRNRLLEHEVIVEKMSGDVQDVEISAKEKTGLDKLLEAISVQAELLELKANPDRMAEATVIEAQLDKGRGPVATVLVTRGTLERGNTFVVGTQSGRVRAIVDDQGKQIKKAGPSMPVEVLGLGGVPSAGDVLTVVENEQRAREVAEYRQEKATEKRTALAPTSFDTMFNNLAANVIEFPVLVKADVQGSVEAITSALHNLSNDEIKVRVLHAGVGAITESDVTLAAASNAPIIGFNVRPNAKARELVKRDGVEMKYYDVIYHLTEEIAKEMAGELGPERIEHVVGRAAVKEVFRSGKKDKAAGLLVEEGVIRKGLHARLTRDDVIVSATTIASLRRFKDDVDEVRAGLECGVVLADTNDIKAGDQLEVFEVEERERTL